MAVPCNAQRAAVLGAQPWASAASSRTLNVKPCAFPSRALAISAPSGARSPRAPSRALSAVTDSERFSNRAHPALALSLQKLTAASTAARRALAARARRTLAALTSRATRCDASSSTRNGLVEPSARSRVKLRGAGEPRPPRWPRARGGGRHRLATARGCRRCSRLSPLSAERAFALSRGGGLVMYHTPEVRGLRLWPCFQLGVGWCSSGFVISLAPHGRCHHKGAFFSLKSTDGQFKRGTSLETYGGRFPLVAHGTGQHQRPVFFRAEVTPAGSRRHMAKTRPKND